ncbi:hypothetical protein HaLaN_11456, partial [Haematococcus lacustris]
MEWPTAAACWQRVSHMALQVMTNGGPWHARRVVEGDAATDALRDAWLQALRVRQPDITLASPLRHSPAARLLVIRRSVNDVTPRL